MAVTAQAKLDARKLRADFPIFEQQIHGKPLAYLDSANSSQKPRQVLDTLRDVLRDVVRERPPRPSTSSASRSDAAYDGAREKARAFVNAETTAEVIFTRNATEGLNLVAYAWGLDNLGPGDLVLATELEHHSNFVPWQYIAGRTGADFAVIPIDDNGRAPPRRARGAGEARAREAHRRRAGLELARHDQPDRADLGLGARARRRRRGRRCAGRAAQAAGRSALGCDFLGVHGAQDVRSERHRRPVGAAGAARGGCPRSSSAAR